MTLKGLFLLSLLIGAVGLTAWARWRLAHGPLRGPRRLPGRGPGGT